VNFVANLFSYGEKFVAPRETPNQDNHPSLAIRDCFSQYVEAVSYIRNLRTRHAEVTKDPWLLAFPVRNKK
jgi:hypothetical protein